MPQEPLQDPDGLEVISSPQVSRRGRRNSNPCAFCHLLLVSQSHAGSSPALAALSLCKPLLVSFHVKP